MKRCHRLLLTVAPTLVLGLVLTGCNTPSDLPRGARLVGGGLKIDFQAPSDGTAIYMERTSRRMIATESVSAQDFYRFDATEPGNVERLFSMFAPTNALKDGTLPSFATNTFFELYFVPIKSK